MGASIPIPLGQCLGVVSRAAPGSPPGPGCSLLATPHGAQPAFSMQHLNPLLAVPRGQRVWWAMGHILMAPVDVPVQAGQHRTPWVASWKFWLPTHQQCPIIDCPHKVLEVAGVIYIQQGQGIWHAHPLCPMLLLSASQCGEAQNLVSDDDLLVHTPLPRNTSSWCRELGCMVGVLNMGMHVSLPPNTLLFHSPSVAWEKVLPVCLVNTASNLQATSVNIK